MFFELGADRIGGAAHHHELGFVGDRAVVGDPVHLVALGCLADSGQAQLDLVGLLLFDERGAQDLRVDVREHTAGDVAPVVGVAADVGDPDAGGAQGLELVVAPDGGEPDPVVDLRHLVQGRWTGSRPRTARRRCRSSTTTLRPRAMPLRASSERSRINWSSEE